MWDGLATAAQSAAVPIGVFLAVCVVILFSAAIVRVVTGKSTDNGED
jgi:hypothetical protein